MPIYKMDGKKDGKQKYRVRINYIDNTGKSRQIDRVAYGKEEAKDLERELTVNLREETMPKMTLQQSYEEYIEVKRHEVRESTLTQKQITAEKYILPLCGNLRIDKLTTRSLQSWKSSMEEAVTRKGEPLSTAYKKSIFAEFIEILKNVFPFTPSLLSFLSLTNGLKPTLLAILPFLTFRIF